VTLSFPFHHTDVAPEAIERVIAVLKSGWLNEGAVTKEFESELTNRLGLVGPVALNSGTSALHLALLVAGVEAGDEVVIPAQTFVATGTAVLMCGARPVFCDIDPQTGNMDPAMLQAKISGQTRAIIPVHWGGAPCNLAALGSIAQAAGVVLIEDAAHALGAHYQGRPIGSISPLTAFSFQSIKHLTTGDGGALCCLDPQTEKHARSLRWFGIDRSVSRPSFLGARDYDLGELGFKYHMNNVAAALGLGNLSQFPHQLSTRRAHAAQYRAALEKVAGIRPLLMAEGAEHAYWLFTVAVERRDEFVRAMTARSIPVSVVDLGIDRNSLFAPFRADLPGQRQFDETQVSLPVHPGLRSEDVGAVIDAIRLGW
jgi:perosamine synthetase